jgi:dihydroxyacetone kinase-like protein
VAATITVADVRTALDTIRQIMEVNRDRLIELDNDLGDGDLGLTMTKGFAAAADEVSRSEETKPGRLLMKAGMQMAKEAPSTLGTLLATGLMRGGKALESQPDNATEQMAALLQACVAGMTERGKTARGNKTIIDSLGPAADAFTEAAAQGATLAEGLAQAAEAARAGEIAAREMQAQHGRAAYYQEQSIGKPDGGAVVGVLIVEGFAQTWG